MRRFGNRPGADAERSVSEEFRHALQREILRTEMLRVKALIAIAILLVAALTVAHLIAPGALRAIYHGDFQISYVFAVYFLFMAFELSVFALINRQLKLGRDVPIVRRYLGALIETSLPTIALAVHIHNMGVIEGSGYVAPLLYSIFIILSTLRLDFWLSAFTGFVAAAELFSMVMFYPSAHPVAADEPTLSIVYHFSRSLVILATGILAGVVGAQLRRQFEASIAAATARDHVTNLFGQHVSPQVVERLLVAGPEAASDTRRVAIMFVDIRGFTAAARSRSPQDVVERLDSAFAIMVEIVDRNGGIVNKFLGDGFLALFGAPFEDPQAAPRAVAAAREMLAAIARDNETRAWPLRIGIGLHLGDVVAGNVGSPRRKEYTVIGDTVNFASRLETLNKEFGSQLLVSDPVHAALGTDGADAVSLGTVPIRGYDQPMAVWRLA